MLHWYENQLIANHLDWFLYERNIDLILVNLLYHKQPEIDLPVCLVNKTLLL